MTFYFIGVLFLSCNDFAGWMNPAQLQLLAMVLNLCFRVLYPVSFLVTVVVTFVLYPTAVKYKMNDQIERFFFWPVIVMHCFNVLMVQEKEEQRFSPY
jgi:hypothetical protein